MIPQERIQRAVEDVVDILVELTKWIPLACVSNRIVEPMVDSPAPLIMMETIAVARSILQERIQRRTVEEIAVSVAHFQDQNERHSARTLV